MGARRHGQGGTCPTPGNVVKFVSVDQLFMLVYLCCSTFLEKKVHPERKSWLCKWICPPLEKILRVPPWFSLHRYTKHWPLWRQFSRDHVTAFTDDINTDEHMCCRYHMITTKPRGCISAVQTDSNSQPVFDDDFPETCLLSKFVNYCCFAVLTFWLIVWQYVLEATRKSAPDKLYDSVTITTVGKLFGTQTCDLQVQSLTP